MTTAARWLALLLITPVAYAADSTNTDPAREAENRCRAEVSKFEQTIGFIRNSQGVEAANQLKEKLLPSKLESELLFTEGYCGLARHLREKKIK